MKQADIDAIERACDEARAWAAVESGRGRSTALDTTVAIEKRAEPAALGGLAPGLTKGTASNSVATRKLNGGQWALR